MLEVFKDHSQSQPRAPGEKMKNVEEKRVEYKTQVNEKNRRIKKMKLTMATIEQELKDKHLQNDDLEDIQKRFKGNKYRQ